MSAVSVTLFFTFSYEQISMKKNKDCIGPTSYKKEMFHCNYFDTIAYLITPNDVYLYKDQL